MTRKTQWSDGSEGNRQKVQRRKKMTLDEIKKGESKNVEFKVQLNEESALQLCSDIRRYIAQSREIPVGKVREITVVNLENWGIIRKSGESYLPTNAIILLTKNTFRFAKIQCALFKGENRAVFVDRREFDGPVYDQIEEAY